jgi:endoribonuclease LACTB2
MRRLTPLVTTISGMNPGKMTLDGTNTYLVGSGTKRILIDTGEGHPDYVPLLRKATADAGVEISCVLLTHIHGDHVGGAKDVRSLFPACTLHKFPSQHDKDATVLAGLEVLPLRGAETFAVDGATVRAVHTPGHCEDHVCFFLEEERGLFSGDTILGTGTTVFACYNDYMQTLRMLKDTVRPLVIYPSHGPMVADADAKIDEYIRHRQAREEQILQTVAATGGVTVLGVVKAVYKGLAEELVPAAAINVSHHLRKLSQEARVVAQCRSDADRRSVASTGYEVAEEGASSAVPESVTWALPPAQNTTSAL